VFKNKWAAFFLARLHCLPIYRKSEGHRLMKRNTGTFDRCLDIFKQGENILIFCEGLCENEWALRPLGKGTARLAFLAWEQQETSHLKVIPAGLTYQNFHSAGKNVFLLTGEQMTKNMFANRGDSAGLHVFNERLKGNVHYLVLHVAAGTAAALQVNRWIGQLQLSKKEKASDAIRTLQRKADSFSKTGCERDIQKEDGRRKPFFRQMAAFMLFLLSSIGWLIHAPLYYPLKWLTIATTKGTVFHDSVLFGLLFLLYPLYLVLLAAVLWLALKNYGCCLVFPAAPVLAFITIRHPPLIGED
jgi:hypothetical protein